MIDGSVFVNENGIDNVLNGVFSVVDMDIGRKRIGVCFVSIGG